MKKSNRVSRTRADVIFDSFNYIVLTLSLLAVAYPLYFRLLPYRIPTPFMPER